MSKNWMVSGIIKRRPGYSGFGLFLLGWTIGPSWAGAQEKPAPKLEITGVVLDPQGRPVKGALVYTLPPPPASILVFATPTQSLWQPTDARSITTGEDGRFTLEHTRAPLAVRAELAPHAAASLENVVPGAQLTLRLTAGVTHSGRVFHAASGEPAAGIEVIAIEMGLKTPPGVDMAGRVSAISDRTGRFLWRGLRPRPQFVSLKSKTLLLPLQQLPFQPGAADSTLTVTPGALSKGQVRDSQGRAIVGAAVSFDTSFWGRSASTQTDASGKFEAVIRPGRYVVNVTHRDFAPATVEGHEAALGATEALIVQMSRGAVASGRLVDEKGVAVVGEVVLRLFGRPTSPTQGRAPTAPTTRLGRFSIPRIPQGQHELDIRAKGFAQKTIPVVASREGGLDLGDVSMESGLRIAGRVVNELGDPIASARVVVNASIDAARAEPFDGDSDEDGRFNIVGVRAGRYYLSATAEGYARESNQRVSSGDDEVVVTLRRAGRARARVLEAGGLAGDGQPVSMPVRLVGQPLERGIPIPNRAEQVPNASGDVVFDNLAIGPQSLEIGAVGYLRHSLGTVTIEPGKVTELGQVRLDRGFEVLGKVVDVGGRPVPGADVEAPFREMNRLFERKTTSDGDGRFRFSGITAGSIEIVATHAAYATARTSATVDLDGSSEEVVVVLRAGGRITGTLKRRNGDPAPGAYMSYYSQSGFGPDWTRTRAETDSLGAFSFENVPPGQTSVSVFHGKGNRFEATMGRSVTVREGEESAVHFTLRETVIRGRVTGAATRANLRVRLSPSGVGGGAYGGMSTGASLPSSIPRGSAFTAADGSFELMVDQPGPFSAELTSYDGSEIHARRQIEVPDVDTFPLDFALGDARLIVTVLDEATRAPVPDAFVQAAPIRGGGSSGGSTSFGAGGGRGTTGSDGRATVILSNGEYRISASSLRHVAASTTSRVEGQAEVTLSLEAGHKISGRVRTSAGVVPPGYYVTAGPVGGGAPRSAVRLPAGTFEITGLRPGRYRIHASAAEEFAEAEADAGAEDIHIDLRPGGTVEVQVVDESNRPVVGAAVGFANQRGEPLSDVTYYTNDTGGIVMPMPAGTAVVLAGKARLIGKASVEVRAGETVVARVVLGPPPAN